MTTLAEFLLARYDAIEAQAKDGADGIKTSYCGWHTVECGTGLGYWADNICLCRYVDSVLADIAAKRRIVELALSWKHYVCEDGWYTCDAATEEIEGETNLRDDHGTRCDCGTELRRDALLRLLAAPYVDHPDYLPEWAV